MRMKIMSKIGILLVLVLCRSGVAEAQWATVNNSPNASTCLLLTDGTILCQNGEESNSWRRLTPDQFGHYETGTWSNLANSPAGYAPLYYASAVLTDGRVVVIGGEYNNGCSNPRPCWVSLGYIFDPVANSWSALLTVPNTFTIGDAQSVVLPNGTFLLADINSGQIAQLNPSTLTFSKVNGTGGTGKLDNHDEENWTLLPNGTVLTVDAGQFTNPSNTGGTAFEIYNPATFTWTSPGFTSVNLADIGPGTVASSAEVGPAVLRPDGTVVYFSGHVAGGIGIYNTATGTWATATNFPTDPNNNNLQLTVADGPASLLQNGNVLVQASPGVVLNNQNKAVFQSGSHYFEFDTANNLTDVTAGGPATNGPSFHGRMLLLPTGQVLYTNGSNDVRTYTPGGTFQNSWRPSITSAPANVDPGQTNAAISGKQFNGLSQASSYGDDAQNATNYPLVRITNHATGHVFYARTHDHSSMGVATGNLIVSTQFDTPGGMETGASDLVVVANGIPSEPIVINGPDLTIAKTHAPFLFTQGDSGDTFTITVGNGGKSATSGVVTVVDILPPSLTATAMSGTGWSCNVATLTCTRNNPLPAGNNYDPILLTVNVDGNAPISVNNTAKVSGGGEASTFNVTDNDTVVNQVSIRQHTITTVQPAADDYDDVVTLRATVSPAGVVGTVEFVVNGSSVGLGIYNSATGVATLNYLIPLPSGSYSLRANFTSGDVLYLDSTQTLPTGLTVFREETTLSYTGDTVIANGGTATMSGVLLEDGVKPILGRTVHFTLGTGGSAQTCDGVTNASGIATCPISPVLQPLGPGVVADAFAGDPFYLPANAGGTTIVFAFLTTGGFVVGDQTPAIGTNATFWDAQWSTVNSLSGGAGPASFKGFAGTLSLEPPKCGITWTTRPGNSSDPPAGPLPSYMGVLVPTSVLQSGSTISGDVFSIVVVQTTSGYAPNPGHAGTGLVVAQYCHQ